MIFQAEKKFQAFVYKLSIRSPAHLPDYINPDTPHPFNACWLRPQATPIFPITPGFTIPFSL